MVINACKEEGETPLELIERLRESGQIGKGEKATYAGRLDPMASGEMIILTGEDVYRKEEFYKKDKEYEVEVLFGFATDTSDILGKVTDSAEMKNFSSDLFLILQSFVGKFTQEYPRYSSKVIAMKDEPEELPKREVEIYSVDYLSMWEMSALEMLADIQMRIARIKGDFRQKEILNLWQSHLLDNDAKYTIVKIKVACGSGTFMRSLANNLGKKLEVPALAFSIKRTKVDELC